MMKEEKGAGPYALTMRTFRFVVSLTVIVAMPAFIAPPSEVHAQAGGSSLTHATCERARASAVGATVFLLESLGFGRRFPIRTSAQEHVSVIVPVEIAANVTVTIAKQQAEPDPNSVQDGAYTAGNQRDDADVARGGDDTRCDGRCCVRYADAHWRVSGRREPLRAGWRRR
jgi:hypothetical protein